MFPIGQVIIGIFILALLLIMLMWWIFKPLGKKLRKVKKDFIKYIENDEE